MNNLENNKMKTYLYGHTSQETAYLVQDYPWGFRLRTQIRYWIESKEAKNGGQRFCSQTINPKTGVWCAPKKSTYSTIEVMYLNENNHVKMTALRFNDSEEAINKFKDIHLEHLDSFQRNQLKELIAYEAVMKNVTWTIKPSSVGPVSLLSRDPIEIEKRKAIIAEQELHKANEERNLRAINFAIGQEYKKVEL